MKQGDSVSSRVKGQDTVVRFSSCPPSPHSSCNLFFKSSTCTIIWWWYYILLCS